MSHVFMIEVSTMFICLQSLLMSFPYVTSCVIVTCRVLHPMWGGHHCFCCTLAQLAPLCQSIVCVRMYVHLVVFSFHKVVLSLNRSTCINLSIQVVAGMHASQCSSQIPISQPPQSQSQNPVTLSPKNCTVGMRMSSGPETHSDNASHDNGGVAVPEPTRKRLAQGSTVLYRSSMAIKKSGWRAPRDWNTILSLMINDDAKINGEQFY